MCLGMKWSFKRQWRIYIKMWSTRRVVTADWPAIWSTVTYHNHVWRTQQLYQLYQNGWSQDAEIPHDETILCMPTIWIHWERNTAALLPMVIVRQTHLAVWLCTPLLSLSHALSYFMLVFVVVTKLRHSITATNISEKHGGRIKVFYSPTNAHVSLKNNIKIHIKIAPTCFGAVTPSSGSILFMLAKAMFVKIANYRTSVCD